MSEQRSYRRYVETYDALRRLLIEEPDEAAAFELFMELKRLDGAERELAMAAVDDVANRRPKRAPRHLAS